MKDKTHKNPTTGTRETHDANPDPITGESGAHPVGTGVGSASGGLAGVAIGGAVGGPIGAVVGGTVGAVAGGLAGKGIAEGVNPTAEDAYWRENYKTRDYVDTNLRYDEYQPAYRYGWEARDRYSTRPYTEVESDLERGWENAKGQSKLTWHQAKGAVKDAWNRVENRFDDDDHWRQNYRSRDYYDASTPYEEYQPAYRYGAMARSQYRGRNWNDVEGDLERGWENAKGHSKLAWHKAKGAAKDAWHHAERAMPGDADRDLR